MGNNELDLTFKKFSELETGSDSIAAGDKLIVSDVSDDGKVVVRPVSDLTDVVRSTVVIPDDTSYDVLAENSGKVHVIPNLSDDCTINLPDAADGLSYQFIYKGTAEDTKDVTFDTGSDTNFYLGGVTGLDDDDGDISVIYPDGDSNSIMKIDTLNAGSKIELYCDGTNWIVNGLVVSGTDTHTAFSDQ